MKKNKLINIIFYIILLSSILIIALGNDSVQAADDVGAIITAMQGTSEPEIEVGDKGIMGTINSVIGFIQIAGSGISILAISLVGIKYMIASPSEKAELKKSAMPIVIGCVLLFGAVNIIGMVENFAKVLQ